MLLILQILSFEILHAGTNNKPLCQKKSSLNGGIWRVCKCRVSYRMRGEKELAWCSPGESSRNIDICLFLTSSDKSYFLTYYKFVRIDVTSLFPAKTDERILMNLYSVRAYMPLLTAFVV